MKKQEILDLLSLTELPAPAPQGKGKCAALVQRTTGQCDYVITKGGGVIIDIGYKSAIVRILEYYPVPAVQKEKQTPVEEPALNNFARLKAITFLEKKNFRKEKLLKKTDQELQELMDGFK